MTNEEKLAAIRGILAAFDWEHDDRQIALETINSILDAPEPVS